ncbi:PD-(D/E)XK motif protein [Stenomitos frigidus]|uniref:PD-(D/E)XK motif protein n=1 Tax=Stenomitos frigidus ULC18 TaxID=2107698 RepID=A0A2T1ELU8_9CYAN|nr:PD-(D/E)XK motif protein [Stenomitos frigidus]PSB33719.1 hypothetical protein C7B82_04355 [Stenomitos frigidus ULC18]
MSIRELWNELERDVQQDRSGYVTRRVRPDSICDLRVAVMEPQGTRTLLLKARRIIIELIQEYPESAGFQVQLMQLAGESPDYLTLQLTLTQSRYSDIFTALADDIIAGVAEKKTEEAGLEEFIVRLKRWQAFLKANQPDGLSEEQQRGLYGELWFLRQVASLSLEPLRGIQFWTGPRGTQQDFQFARSAIEVKTTISKQHQKLTIASERQLDDSGTGTLILLHLSLDSRPGRGEALPDIVTSLRLLLVNHSAAREEFENHLFAVGYLDIHALRYEQIGYIVRETNYFKVEGGFPRIIESDLCNGIGDVRYTISVAECKRFAIAEADVLSLIGVQS